jgi:transcriptional regulator with XRE-family HTH domain
MKKSRAYLPATEQAAAALAAQIAASRRELGWTQEALAGRLGVDRHLVAKIEAGSPSVTLGIALEAAIVCGVPLFDVRRDELSLIARQEQVRVALLPARVREQNPVISDDF